MKYKKTLLCSLLLISCLILVTSMPVFAAELTEAEVQQAVDAQGKETVTGNVFIWFLCAIAFLKVSQKIDSFMASLGVNVGNTGGNMMAELLIAGRGLASSFRGHGGGSHSSSHSSSPGSAAVQSSFLSGGLAGAVGRQTERSAVNAATLMNRKKAILAIFMMAFLIIIGFVFPSIWKSQKGNKKSETENTQHDNNENTETEQAENNESISFQDFEALEDFFSKEQVKLFQEELTSYLKNVKQMSLTSIRFLADDTTYPNASDINFLFQLPDKSVLPVYYTSSTGRFFFGEERTPDSGKEIIYERPTDDKLPSITTEEIEQLQEGGYDDTSVNSEKAAPVTEVPETPSMEEPKEVQP